MVINYNFVVECGNQQILLSQRRFSLFGFTLLLMCLIFNPAIINGPAMAQSLSTIRVGDSASQLETLGVSAISKQKMGPHTAILFELPDGNYLSATYRNSDGKIVFLESDWGEKQSGSFTDFRSFKFGITSLNDIRQELGHNGMSFVNGPGTNLTAEGDLVMFNSYEVAGSAVVVTVINKITAKRLIELSKTHGEEKTDSLIGKEAKLDAVIIADNDYLSGIWGNEVTRDKGYKRIAW